jgi:hypothetical protein
MIITPIFTMEAEFGFSGDNLLEIKKEKYDAAS